MAILNRLTTGDTPRKSLKRYAMYAIGEVVLIFAGITLSIWFSNWNEGRKDREIEVNILRELRDALADDLSDVQFNIQLREDAKDACSKILSLMANQSDYHDSIGVYFSQSFQLASTVVKTSAYENLKSRGLQVITNDSLRSKIIDLYDARYEHLVRQESFHEDLFFNFLVHFNSKRFNTTNPYDTMKPLDYQLLMKDKEYKYYLGVLIFYNNYLVGESRSISKDVTDLRVSLAREIANLE